MAISYWLAQFVRQSHFVCKFAMLQLKSGVRKNVLVLVRNMFKRGSFWYAASKFACEVATVQWNLDSVRKGYA